MKNKSRELLKLRRVWLVGTGILVLALAVLWHQSLTKTAFVPLPTLVEDIKADKVQQVEVQGDILLVKLTDETTIQSRKESSISVFETLKFLGVPASQLEKLNVTVAAPTSSSSPLVGTFFSLALIGALGWVGFTMMRQTRGGQNSLMGFSRSRARLARDGEQPNVAFEDVAGCEPAKIELAEIVEFLKEPSKFMQLGARIPKGVIMVGPPGTGKTLLAKAVAGEAGVPFFSISGSEFVEMFVGVGASRVRDLFNKAKEHSPSIIFVDEIDAVGRQRGMGVGGGHEEREQTLNQILVEMDGFGTGTNVIVIAATNRPDILDAALLRPGRFDRKVVLDRPDVRGREAIFGVHTRGKPLSPEVSLTALAKLTPGFAGADIENMVNEAAILAARRNLRTIGRGEFADALERIIAGPERSKLLLNAHERKVVAYHEAGHAVAMYHLPCADPVHKVTIMSRGMALGFTMPLPEGEKVLRTREAFEDEIASLLAGRAAEEVVFKQVTTGAANDLERATAIAQQMVTRFGMSDRLGLRAFGQQQSNAYLGLSTTERDYGEEIARLIDEEVRRFIDEGYRRARQLLLDHYDRLEAVACALLERETLEREDFESLMQVQ